MVDAQQPLGDSAGTGDAPPPQPPPPPNWYPDGAGGWRYWDGAQWTVHQPAAAAARAVATGPPPAPWGRRIPAFLIDMALLIPGTILFLVIWVHEFNRVIDSTADNGVAPVPRFWVMFLGWSLNFVIMIVNRGVVQGLTGKTLGKMIMKVRLVRIDDGADPGLGWGLLRMIIEAFTGMVDVVVAFVNDTHQRLGDLAGRTIVVDDAVAAELREKAASRRT